jgi:hypothetical protein
MIIAGVLIAIPVMGLLVAFDFWHCRARPGHADDARARSKAVTR